MRKVTCFDASEPVTANLVEIKFDGFICDLSYVEWSYPDTTSCINSNYHLYFWADNSVTHVIELTINSSCCDGMTHTFTVNYPAGYIYMAALHFLNV